MPDLQQVMEGTTCRKRANFQGSLMFRRACFLGSNKPDPTSAGHSPTASSYMLLAGRTGGDGRYTGLCGGLTGMSAKDARIGLMDTDTVSVRRFSSVADIFATRSRISMGDPPEQPPPSPY